MINTYTPFAVFSPIFAVDSIFYFVGIGGVGMSGLAHIAHQEGFRVRGCDRVTDSDTARKLRAEGIPVEREADADPRGAALVIYSLAIPENTPAIVKAGGYGIPLVSRADFMAALTHRYSHRIAVAGMHGKSTTVGMLSAILISDGQEPTVISGAPLTPGGETYRIGRGDICLMEACEYCDSFLTLHPTLSVVTNIELDHPDYFPSLTAVEHSFSRFLWQSDRAVIGGDCPALHALADPTVLRFGMHAHNRLRGEMTENGMYVIENGAPLGEIRLQIPGDYNYENALAATAAARALGVSFDRIAASLAAFPGIGRRMEAVGVLGTRDGGACRVYLDYAHHPTELTCALSAARTYGGRLLAVFQPHTYSRTRALWGAFCDALRHADDMTLIDIYAAREADIYGTSSSRLAEEAGVSYRPTMQDAAHHLTAMARDGDTILLLGAGDIDRMLALLPLSK